MGSGLGQIVVHDRNRVETEVLPRYFNHASFASLRRQLNYFNFARVGKGRQRGATYCNENVVNLDDILRLKRRVVGSNTSTSTQDKSQNKNQVKSNRFVDTPVPKVTPQPPTKKSQENTEASDTKISVTQGTNLAQMSRGNEKSSGRKRYNSIVPVVHLLPKKAKTQANLSPRSSRNKRSSNLANFQKTERIDVPLAINRAQNPSTDQSSVKSSGQVDANRAIYLDLTQPYEHTNRNHSVFVSQSGSHSLVSNDKPQSIGFHQSYDDMNSYSGVRSTTPMKITIPNEVAIHNREVMLQKSNRNDCNSSVPENRPFAVLTPTLENSPYLSSEEMTDEDEVVACEDIVACNVLLTLGCR